MVNGKLLQMNKRYKDLKNRQKDKIAGWMEEMIKLMKMRMSSIWTIWSLWTKMNAVKLWKKQGMIQMISMMTSDPEE